MANENEVESEVARDKLHSLQEHVSSNLENSAEESFPELEISYVDRSLALSKLITEDEYTLKIKNRDYELRFKEPIYLDYLEIVFDGKDHDLSLLAHDLSSGSEKSFSSRKTSSNVRRFSTNILTKSLTLSAPKKTIKLGAPRVSGLHLVGLHVKDFKQRVDWLRKNSQSTQQLRDRFQSLHSEISSAIEVLSDRENSATAIEQKITELASSQGELSAQVAEKETELNRLQTNIEGISEKTEKLRAESKALENSLRQQNSEREQINEEISEKRAELSRLTSDTNLFSEEIRTFNIQSNTQKRIYFVFALLPITLLGVLCVDVFFHASAYVSASLSWQETLNLLVSRVPFLGASVAVAWAAYNLGRIFIQKVIDLDRQQLSFSKLAIIAREVSKSAAEDSGLSVDDEYERRVALKMTLIKAHLREELGHEFDYQKTIEERLDNMSVWKRIFARSKRDELEQEDDDSTGDASVDLERG